MPYLAVVNVQDGFIELDPLKSINATATEIERYALHVGDILLTEGGDPGQNLAEALCGMARSRRVSIRIMCFVYGW